MLNLQHIFSATMAPHISLQFAMFGIWISGKPGSMRWPAIDTMYCRFGLLNHSPPCSIWKNEYPGIAIQGVEGYNENGDTIRINEMTIDEKVDFWQKSNEIWARQGIWYLFLHLEYLFS